MTYEITLPNGLTINLTGPELADLHDQLTTIYNEHYESIEIPRR